MKNENANRRERRYLLMATIGNLAIGCVGIVASVIGDPYRRDAVSARMYQGVAGADALRAGDSTGPNAHDSGACGAAERFSGGKFDGIGWRTS